MEIDDLITLMRKCSLAQVRQELELWKKKDPDDYEVIVGFYNRASRRKPS